MANFWANNSCVPSWTGFLGQVWSGAPPNLLETDSTPRQILQNPNVRVMKVSGTDRTPEVVEFWSRYFSISSTCRCRVPLTHLQENLKSGKWDLYIAQKGSGEVVGTLVRRWVSKVSIQGVKWARIGVVDYFCIHPGWRKRGLGRALLSTLHNQTPAPIPPHLIFWEGLAPSIPPLAVGTFWAWKPGAVAKESLPKEAWKKIQKAGIYSEEAGSEIWIGKSRSGLVAIWDTFHVSVPEGYRIGILIGTESQGDTLEGLQSPFGVVLSNTKHTGQWRFDSPYQWIGYNLKHSSIQLDFPQLGF